MCSKDDFLNWDDLDLDNLLVDYTDYDDAITTDSDSTIGYDFAVAEESVENVSPAVAAEAKPKATRRPYVYSCPVCNKKLRSPSGFRGHIINKHPTFNRNSFKGNQIYILLL